MQLPKYKGYTVDYRLREFRKVDEGLPYGIEFVPFDSDLGDQLLVEMIRKKLVPDDVLVSLF